jgi:hypothetical protein
LVDVRLSGSPVVVDDLDDDFVLQLIQESEVQAREADRRKLRLAVHWAERHVVSDVLKAAHWTDADPRDVEETIGGAGTPLIDAGVEDLRIAPWRARRIANLTHGLSEQAAAYVDAQLAPVADSCGLARIERLVTEAIARFDPAEQAEAEDEAKATWGVLLQHYSGTTWAGTSRLEITGDTPTLTRFYDLVCATAHDQLDPDEPAGAQPSPSTARSPRSGSSPTAQGPRPTPRSTCASTPQTWPTRS